MACRKIICVAQWVIFLPLYCSYYRYSFQDFCNVLYLNKLLLFYNEDAY